MSCHRQRASRPLSRLSYSTELCYCHFHFFTMKDVLRVVYLFGGLGSARNNSSVVTRCGSGHCVHADSWCDFTYDCCDGTDENAFECASYSRCNFERDYCDWSKSKSTGGLIFTRWLFTLYNQSMHEYKFIFSSRV